jgi:uncharacterized membrane protein (DUF485 family)
LESFTTAGLLSASAFLCTFIIGTVFMIFAKAPYSALEKSSG